MKIKLHILIALTVGLFTGGLFAETCSYNFSLGMILCTEDPEGIVIPPKWTRVHNYDSVNVYYNQEQSNGVVLYNVPEERLPNETARKAAERVCQKYPRNCSIDLGDG